jgi:aryl-alcohol dehydrogenase-like predicted oxidoreductase
MPMSSAGNVYGVANDDEAIRTIHEAIDLGVTLFDTAEAYGPFSNEELLGKAIKGKRDDLIVSTKFALRWEGTTPSGLDGSPAHARRACEGSLKRLGVEVIDLFFLHRVDPNTPIEETVGGMAELVKEGKVRHLGLSEVSANTLRRASKVHPIASLQTEYSVWERSIEDEILPSCRELGIGLIAYSPLGRGMLTGDIRSPDMLGENDQRRRDPRYNPENFAANLKMVDALAEIAAAHGITNAQVALAWLLSRGADVVPIPGVKRRETMRNSVAAADVRLTAEDLASVEQAAPKGLTAGPRYNEAGMATVNA